jgi:hypothetical protein
MNIPYAIAGGLAFLGALVHGLGGQVWILQRLRTDTLPSTPFGGPHPTRVMVWVTWHLVTVTMAVMGATLMSCAGSASGAHCSGVGRLVAGLFAAFALLSLVYGVASGSARLLVRHLGPWAFVAIAVLAWVGSG